MNSRNALDPSYIRMQIDALRSAYPGIWDDEPLLADMLEAETQLHELLGLLVFKICEAEAMSFDKLFADLRARQGRYERRIEGLRAMALNLLTYADVRKLELPQATLSVSAGQRKVLITDEASLPDDCFRIKREPNKIEIKRRIEGGDDIPGATLSNAEPHLSMRPR